MLDKATEELVKSYWMCGSEVAGYGRVAAHSRRAIAEATGISERMIRSVRDHFTEDDWKQYPFVVIQRRGAPAGAPFVCKCGLKVQPTEQTVIVRNSRRGTEGVATRPRPQSDSYEAKRAERRDLICKIETGMTTGGVVQHARARSPIDPMVRMNAAVAEFHSQMLTALSDLDGYESEALLNEYWPKTQTGFSRSERMPVTERLTGGKGKLSDTIRLLQQVRQEVALKSRRQREKEQDGNPVHRP
jgi:hypothetical protein